MSVKKGGRFTKNHFSIPKTKNTINKTKDMITIDNITAEYNKFEQRNLPEALKASEFEFVKENLDLYGEDETIDEYINTFISKLNEIEGKKVRKPDKTKAVQKPRKVKSETKKQSIKVKHVKKAKTVKTAKTKAFIKEVGDVDLQIKFIKSFVLMNGKTVAKERILNLYKRIEKAAAELKIRKTSAHAKNILYVVNFLKDSYNDKKFNIEIPKQKFEELKQLAGREKQMLSVLFIKRYVNLYGKEDKVQAKRLFEAIKKAAEDGKITSKDLHFEELKKIKKSLESFINQNTQLYPENFDLKGLAGIAGLTCPCKKKSLNGLPDEIEKNITENQLPSGIFSATQISNEHFDTVELTGKWKQGIGTISLPFHLLFWGEKGSGKSTLILGLAKYLATEHNLKILFIAKEEGHSFTLKEKINRLSAAVPNLYFAEKLPDDKNFLKQIDVLMIDSVNSIGMSNDELEKLKSSNTNLSTVSLLMSYKSGDTYKGDSDFGHNAQAVFKVAAGKWKAEKNRFGGSEEVDIDFE